MRMTLGLLVAVGAASVVGVACGSSTGSEFGGGGTADTNLNGGSGHGFGSSGGSSSGSSGGPTSADDVDPASLHVEPANALIDLAAGASVTKSYRVLGKVVNTGVEVDLTSRAVFYVPDNFLVGGFPADGAATFTTRPGTADYPQRGGKVTVLATLSNAAGPVNVTTALTVKLSALLATGGLDPADAATKFGGTPTASLAPTLAYPNDGTMLPPNLRRLDVHWKPAAGADANTLYEISFTSATGVIAYYAKCDGTGLVAGACGFQLDEAGYGYVSGSNAGQGPVALQIRATDGSGGGVGTSAQFNIEFAENRVDGGLYYWNVTNTQIMRFDFGAATGSPEVFASGGCIGCHAISRDGTKLVASQNGQNGGQLVFTSDVAATTAKLKAGGTPTEAFTQFGNGASRVQFATFAPDGSQYASVYGDTNDATRQWLYFSDGTTGLRTSHIELAFRPDHPDWSPNGNMIAVTKVNQLTSTSQMPTKTSLSLLTKNGANWDATDLTTLEAGIGRYNPNFAPDSSFLYYSESNCATDTADGRDPNGVCNADSDPSATTYAMKPEANATRVLLANAAKRGVADLDALVPKAGGNKVYATTGDTFPRSAPFQTKHRGGKLFWFTAASRRNLGLAATSGAQHLFMFAVDPAKVLAGTDGSYTGFYLPFQNLKTSNHIGQWTEKIVGGTQAPPPPPPAPPPAPPPPATPH